MRDHVQSTSEVRGSQAESERPRAKSQKGVELRRELTRDFPASVQAFPKSERVNIRADNGNDRGVPPTNRDPQKRHFVGGGLDWFEIRLYGQAHSTELYTELRTRQDRVVKGEAQTWFDGVRTWNIAPRGFGAGYSRVSIVLTCGDLTVGITPDASKGCVGYGKASGKHCALFGWKQAAIYADMCEVFEKLGLEFERYTIGRMDPFVDVVGITPTMFADASKQKRIVTHAKSGGYWNSDGEFETINFDASGVRLRVYDKLAEISAKEGTNGLERYRNLHGLAVLPEQVTRIEYQLTGEFLREKFARWPGQMVIDNMPELMQYLTSNWLRVCEHVDRRNTQRSKPTEWFNEVTDVFKTIFKEGSGMKRPFPQSAVTDVENILAQIRGLVARVAAVKEREFSTVEEYFKFAAGLLVQRPDGTHSPDIEQRQLGKIREAASRVRLSNHQARENYLNAVEKLRGELESEDSQGFDWFNL